MEGSDPEEVVEEEGLDPEKDPPTSPEAAAIALFFGGMEVTEGGRGGSPEATAIALLS